MTIANTIKKMDYFYNIDLPYFTKKESSNSSSKNYIDELNIDLISFIFSFLSIHDIKNVSLVKKKWNVCSNKSYIWQHLFFCHYPFSKINPKKCPLSDEINWKKNFKENYKSQLNLIDGNVVLMNFIIDIPVHFFDLTPDNIFFTVYKQINKDSFTYIHLSPSGKKFVTNSKDYVGKVWDVETGKCLTTLPHQYPFKSIYFSPNENKVITVCFDERLRMGLFMFWDIITGTYLGGTYTTINKEHISDFSIDQNTIAITTFGYDVSVWKINWNTNRLDSTARFLEHHMYPINSVEFSWDLNGSKIVTASPGKAIVSDAITGKCLATLFHEKGDPLTSASFSLDPQGSRIVTTSNHVIKIWDATGKCLSTIETEMQEVFVKLAKFIFENSFILIAYTNGRIGIYNATTGELKTNLTEILIGRYNLNDTLFKNISVKRSSGCSKILIELQDQDNPPDTSKLIFLWGGDNLLVGDDNK